MHIATGTESPKERKALLDDNVSDLIAHRVHICVCMELPPSVVGLLAEVLQKGSAGLIPETPKDGDRIFEKVENQIISSNKKALDAAKSCAESLGFDTEIISWETTGEAKEVGKELAARAIRIRNNGELKRPRCLISGGETTVTVKGKGLGGRNMEMALAFAIEAEGVDGITFLSAGTDGTDGPTDAAGAIVDGDSSEKAKELGVKRRAF